MIKGLGTDIVDVTRIEKILVRELLFVKKIFTENEIQYSEKYKSKAQNYAARFAAKESVMKAFGTGWRDGIEFKDIEIINNELGKPEVFLSGKAKEIADKMNISKIHLSMSHEKNYASAIVIIE